MTASLCRIEPMDPKDFVGGPLVLTSWVLPTGAAPPSPPPVYQLRTLYSPAVPNRVADLEARNAVLAATVDDLSAENQMLRLMLDRCERLSAGWEHLPCVTTDTKPDVDQLVRATCARNGYKGSSPY